MLLRISLIVAILAGLGAGGIGYYEWSTQIPALSKQRDDEKDAKNLALTQLAGTNRILVATQAKLTETQQELADTKSERDKAVARADQPVEQRRLFKPGDAPQPRSHPIARYGHFPADGGVARLVRTNQPSQA